LFADRTSWNLAQNRLAAALDRSRATGEPIIDLTVSNPTECGFSYPIQGILAALADPDALTYDPQPKGLLSAREAVAGYYAARGDAVPPDNLILTTSTSEAYSFVFRLLCNPGDEILVPTPSYPLFELLADIQDVRLIRYPLLYDHGWQIDFHALQTAVTNRSRGIIVVHPNNPTGHFARSGEVANLNQLAAARDLAIIADEVFLDFSLAAEPRSSFVANRPVLTFTMSGVSKICGLPQMKVAWLVASGPDQVKTDALARLELIADTYLSMNAPTQHAISALLESRDGFHQQLMARVRNNLAQLDRALSMHPSVIRLAIEGGWYAVLRVPATRSDEEIALELLESKGAYVHPGHFYDFPSEGHLVVSLIAREHEFAEGVKAVLSGF